MSPDQRPDQHQLLDADDLSTATEPAAPIAVIGVDEAELAEHVRHIIGAQQSALEHAWHAGRLLARARGAMHHGQWLSWLDRQGIPDRTARRWISLARECPTLEDALARGTVTTRLMVPRPTQIPLEVGADPAEGKSATVADPETPAEGKSATVADSAPTPDQTTAPNPTRSLRSGLLALASRALRGWIGLRSLLRLKKGWDRD